MPPNTIGASQSEPKSGLALRRTLVILVPILIMVGLWGAGEIVKAIQPEPERERREPPMTSVYAEVAAREDIQLYITTQGETQPQTEITLVPQVAGKITYVAPYFNDGGSFTKGDTLLRIDDADYKVAVLRAEADVAQAQQNVIQERVEAELAKKDWEELGQGPASPLTLREPQLKRAAATLASAQASLDNAKLQLSRTYIRAPFSGRIRTKRADIGQFVSLGTPLADIFSSASMDIRLPLSDDELRKLNLPIAYIEDDPADSLKVNIRAVIAGRPQTWTGRITRTDSAYDSQTRALTVIVEVNDPYGAGASDEGVPLPPGLFVTADIEGQSYDQVFVLSRGALRANDEVYIITDNNDLVVKPVEVIDSDANRAIIRTGISSGDVVINSGLQRITPGMKVQRIGAEDRDTTAPDDEDSDVTDATVSSNTDGKIAGEN